MFIARVYDSPYLSFRCLTPPLRSGYLKKLNKKLEETGASAESIDEFKKNAPAAMKKIIANYDNYDVLMGASMDGDAM